MTVYSVMYFYRSIEQKIFAITKYAVSKLIG